MMSLLHDYKNYGQQKCKEQKQLWLEFSCMVLANQNWDGDTIICTQEHLAPIIYKFGIMGVIP